MTHEIHAKMLRKPSISPEKNPRTSSNFEVQGSYGRKISIDLNKDSVSSFFEDEDPLLNEDEYEILNPHGRDTTISTGTAIQYITQRASVGILAAPVSAETMKLYPNLGDLLNDNLIAIRELVIHPNSIFRFYWDLCSLFLVLINLLTIPFSLAYLEDDYYKLSFHLIVKCISDIWFILDILMNFNTGFTNYGGTVDSSECVIMDKVEIRKNYFSFWFWIDILASLPFDLYIDVFNLLRHPEYFSAINTSTSNLTASVARAIVIRSDASNVEILRVFKITRLLTLFKVLRIGRLIRYMRISEKILDFRYDNLIFAATFVFQLSTIFLFCHFAGCTQFMLPKYYWGEYSKMPKTCWIIQGNLHLHATSNFERWSWSLFRSVSQMLCVGYGAVIPADICDLTSTFISMVTGAIFYTVFVGQFTALLQTWDASRRAFKEDQFTVKQYMIFRKLPKELVERIELYFETRFQGKTFNENDILKELNPLLRQEVIGFNCVNLINSVPFFVNSSPDFINMILEKFISEVYLPGDCIIREGARGSCMYFIKQGTVVVRDKNLKLSLRLTDGNYFGELSLLYKDLHRTANVFAETYCNIYMLEKKNLDSALIYFPEMKERMDRLAQDRNEYHGRNNNFDEFSLRDDLDKLSVCSFNSLPDDTKHLL